MSRPAVLVTDGGQRAALAIVRSLGRAGYSAYVCDAREHSLGGASRYATGAEKVPDPAADATGFVEALKRLAGRWGVQVLIPVTDTSLEAVLPARHEFDGVQVPFPDYESYRRISDKAVVLREAEAVGIRIPRQVVLASMPTRAELDGTSLRFPVVAKPARSLCKTRGRAVQVRTMYASGVAELERLLQEVLPQAFPVLVQERLTGVGLGYFVLRWDGLILAACAHRRIREKPPSGGVSVYRESVSLDPNIAALSNRLVERFDWRGVAMVEYKLDAAGTPYLMEVNGRFWGSLQLAIDAGVDFPRLLVEACLGPRPEPVFRYKTGVRSRWWWGDMDHLMARLVKSRRALNLPPDADGRLSALLDFLTVRRCDRNEVLRWGDPLPFVRETVDWLKDLVGRW